MSPSGACGRYRPQRQSPSASPAPIKMGQSAAQRIPGWSASDHVPIPVAEYNIQGIAPGDDYAAMHQALSRRYRRVTGDDSSVAGKMPDLLLIDGGKGQVTSAAAALADLGIEAPASAVNWPELMNAPVREVQTEMISGESPQEVAEKLAEKILAEKVL